MKGLTTLAWLGLFVSNACGGERSNFTFFETGGVRAGTGTSLGERVNGFELFAAGPALRSWSFRRDYSAILHLEGSLGYLSLGDDPAFTCRFGPFLDISRHDSPLHFVLSSSVAYLSDHRHGSLDLGSDFQFVSGAGFDYELSDRWTLGYRWQHISNGGITDRNPGLNLNVISLGFRF